MTPYYMRRWQEFANIRINVESADAGRTWKATAQAYPKLSGAGSSKGRAAIALLSEICTELSNQETQNTNPEAAQ